MILFLRLIFAATCAALAAGFGWFMFTIAMAFSVTDPKVVLSMALMALAGFAFGWWRTRESRTT